VDIRAEKRQAILRECQKRNIRVEQIGEGYRLIGPGVSLMTIDPANLTPADLNPYLPRKYVD
jgi:hypothetical protein